MLGHSTADIAAAHSLHSPDEGDQLALQNSEFLGEDGQVQPLNE